MNNNSNNNQSTLYLPSIRNLPLPNLTEFKLPPILNREKSNTKIFNCKQCKRSFNRKNSLLRHERIHSGVRPYECNNCFKSFSRKDILTRHKESLKCQKTKIINESSRTNQTKTELTREYKSSSTSTPLESPLLKSQYKSGIYYESTLLHTFNPHPLLNNDKFFTRELSPLELPSSIITE